VLLLDYSLLDLDLQKRKTGSGRKKRVMMRKQNNGEKGSSLKNQTQNAVVYGS